MSSLDGQNTDRPRAETQEDTDVVVVGGGLAGLTAARNVSRGGHEVAVVEARDRVGGRLLSEQLPSGQTVDLGGQWVAPSQSRVRALLDEYDIDTQSQYDAGVTHLRIRGEDSTFEGTVPSLSRLALVNVEVATRLLERMSQKVPLDAPHEAPKAETWDATTVETWKRRYVKHPAARELFDVAIRAVLTSEPADVSLLFLLFYVRSGGGFWNLVEVEDAAQDARIAGGAQQLAERLADDLDGAVHCNAPAESIRQREADVLVETPAGAFRGDYAVVAVPPPLQRRIAFDPPLPPSGTDSRNGRRWARS